MAKYYLTYFNNGKKENVKLNELECLSGQDVTDIKIIDDFTTFFDNKDKLLEFLKRNYIIPSYVNHLFISSDYKCKNNEVKKITNGEQILYKDDRKLLSTSFTRRWFTIVLKHTPHFIIRVCDSLKTKYNTDAIKIFDELKNFIINLYKDKKLGTLLDMYESEKFDNLVNVLYRFEFYKKGTKIKLENKNWRHVHDLAVILKDIDESLNYYILPEEYGKKKGYLVFKEEIENPLKVRDNEKKVLIRDEEEFLTREDFDRRDEEDILSHYTKPDYEKERDGHNYIVPKSKDELRRDLETLATQVLDIQHKNRTK